MWRRGWLPIIPLLVLAMSLVLGALAQRGWTDDGDPVRGQKYAVLVGLNRCQQSTITPLRYAVADVEALARALQEVAGFPRGNVYVLTDRGQERGLATKSSILFRVSEVARKTKPGDAFVFYFSGHGVEVEGETYLVSYDADLGNDVLAP